MTPRQSVCDKIDVLYTMEWFFISMLIYNTKFVNIQKPDLMVQNG